MALQGRIKSKVLILLALGIVLPASFVSTYSVVSSSKALTNLVSKQMELEGENSVTSINTTLKTIQSDILYLSKTPPVQGIVRARENKGIDPQDQSTYNAWISRMTIIFSSFLEARSYYYQLRYLDENGNELVRVDSRDGKIRETAKEQLQYKGASSYFKEAMKLRPGDVYVSSINLNRENNKIETPYKPVIRYATPIYSEQGKPRGMVIANILVDPLFAIAESNKLKQEFQQQFSVVNQQGYYLYHYDQNKTWGFELNKDETFNNDYSQATAQQVLSGRSGLTEEKGEHLLSYHPIFPNEKSSSNPFILVYQTPKRVILAPIQTFRNISLVVTLLSLAVTLGLGTKILQQLLNSVSDLMNVVSSFSGQMLANVDQQEQMVSQQSTSVHETTVTVDQLSASSKLSAQQAEAALVTAEQVLGQVNEGNTAVHKTIVQMETLKQKVEAMAGQVLHLSQQTGQIGTVSTLVADLANQTNMLALNAAVEAVRAGEQGKGFAVVAGEIRKLADESRQSGQKISDLVNEIQKAIRETIIVTEAGTKNVEESVQTAQSTSGIFSNITVAMGRVVENSQQIALNSQQQSVAIQQVTEAMNQLTQGATETAQGMSQTKTGTEQLNQAALKLKSIV